MAVDPNETYDAVRCRVCGHPSHEHPRTWGCGHCCPAEAPEVPSRSPKTWRRRQVKTSGYICAEIIHADGEGHA